MQRAGYAGRRSPESLDGEASADSTDRERLPLRVALWMQRVQAKCAVKRELNSRGFRRVGRGYVRLLLVHRLRHQRGFWQVFHQIHHSASRIEILTSFYKHPVEILTNSITTAVLLYPVLGCSTLATFWSEGAEQRLGAMLAFRDVYEAESRAAATAR
jgi:Fatty acid hydroxylase